jgi:hypothetical protein
LGLVGAAAQEQIAGMGLVRRFQQAPDVLLRTVPRRPARRGIVFTAFSRRRVGLRGAQETIRDPAREANFFGYPGTASSRQRLFCGTGLSPPAPHLQVRPFEPWCEPTRARCICVATGVCDFAASASRRGPSAPQSARLSDARVTLTGDDIAPSADLGISRRPSPPQASTRTLRTDFQMGASIPTSLNGRIPYRPSSVRRSFSLSAIRRLRRKLLKTRLNVTHHQAPIFALTLPSLVVDRLADPFERTSQSVDFFLKIIVDRLLG